MTLVIGSSQKLNFCPVCGKDLRPDDMKNCNEEYDVKIFNFYKNIHDIEKELIANYGITLKEYVLVKF